MAVDSIASSFSAFSIDKISAQVDSQLHTLSRELHAKSAIVASSQSLSNTINNSNTVEKTVAKGQDHLTTELQLKLLDKIWVIKNLLQELDLSFQQQFAFQYSSIFYNVSKLEQKLNDLKHFINKHSSTLPNAPGEINASTSSESLASSMSALPGAFEDITPDKLQNTIPDSELVERVTSNDTAGNITIIRAFDSKLDHYKKSFFDNLIKLSDTFLIKEEDSLKILKSVQSEVNDEQEIETETLSVFEFFEFIDENYHLLVEVNSDSQFKKLFSEQILIFIKVIDQVINKALNIRLKNHQSPPKICFQDSDDDYYILSFGNSGLNCISFNSSIQNIIQFLNFFIQLPQFLKYTLKNNPSSHVFKSLSSYVSFSLLLLTNTYNNKKIHGINATDFQQRIVVMIKLTYLLINLRVLSKNDFYFLNFDSNFFANKLTVRSSSDDFLNFLTKIQETAPTDGDLWTSNINQLNDFFIEKKLNQVINQIKTYLQKFDSFDLVFHELVNRFEINFNTIVTTSALPDVTATGVKKDEKSFKRKHTHQPSFSNTSIMASISENDSIDSVLDNNSSNSNKPNEKVESLVNNKTNNRKSNIFALTGGAQKLNFSNFDSTNTATAGDPASDSVSNDKSFNQTALDALTGKSDPDLPNIEVSNGEGVGDLGNGEGLKAPIATVSSPMSPVTPISPFAAAAAAAATNNSIASKLDKKPDDDRIRFSKRFSKQQSMSSLSGDDSSSVNSENSAKLNRRASKRISKRLSKRFSQNDWSWKDEDEEFSFDEDAWGGDDDDLDLNLSDEELNGNNSTNNNIGNSDGGSGDGKDERIVTNKRSSKSINSNIDELDDWGWGDDIDEVDYNDTTVISDPKTELENNKNKRKSLFNTASKKQQQQNDNQINNNNNNNNNNNSDIGKNFKKSKSFKTTFIPDEIFKIISEFVEYLTELNASQHEEYISSEEILSKVLQLIDIYYLIGGYAKYDSKFLFYNDVFYLNMVVKKQLVLQKILENPTENNGITSNNSEDNFKGPILFDLKVENYLTDVINLEKISFLKIYRKFQNFTNLANLQNTNMILNQLEFKFKEMFFASFQNLTIDLQQMVVTNFLNEFYQLVINDILQIAMISEQDSNELSKIISFMLNFVNFFGPSHRQVSSLDLDSFPSVGDSQQHHRQLEKRQKQQEMLGLLEIGSQEYDQLVNEINKNDVFVAKYKKNIVNFYKLANFKTIVSSHLASIMENFYNGELYNVETQELIHLIKSLFVDSEIRRRAISDIEEIRNIDV